MKIKFGINTIINIILLIVVFTEANYRELLHAIIEFITKGNYTIFYTYFPLPDFQFIVIELFVFGISMTIIHERSHCFVAQCINPESHPKFVSFMEMDCDWSVFQEPEVVKVAKAGPLFSICTMLLTAIILNCYFKMIPVTLIVGIFAELTNFTRYRLSSGSFTDGTWLKYPQVRKNFTTEQIKAAANLQELLNKLKE